MVSKFRPKDDHYKTPREASVPFVQKLSDGLLYPCEGPIWEPACGDGALCKVLEEHDYEVIATNLIDRGHGTAGVDFLLEHELRAPAIVTNPPGSLATEFAVHANNLGANFIALLLRTKFLSGRDRHERLFTRYPPAFIYQFIERIRFFAGDTPEDEQPGWDTEDFAWFVWIKHHNGDPRVRWLSRGDGL